jgi:hypothetical protein
MYAWALLKAQEYFLNRQDHQNHEANNLLLPPLNPPRVAYSEQLRLYIHSTFFFK